MKKSKKKKEKGKHRMANCRTISHLCLNLYLVPSLPPKMKKEQRKEEKEKKGLPLGKKWFPMELMISDRSLFFFSVGTSTITF